MAETKSVKIDLNSNSIYGQLGSKEFKTYVKQEPYVGEDGIYIPVEAYVPQGCASAYKCIMTKEMFVEAYNKYINKPGRRYKGGWNNKNIR